MTAVFNPVFKPCTLLLVCSLLTFSSPLAAQFDGAAAPPDQWKAGFDSINDDLTYERLSILASETFGGRGTGQPGYTLAAHWVAGQLAKMGLQPMGDGGTYFQMLPMSRISPDMSESRITGPNDLVIAGEDSLGFDRFDETPEVTGQVTFVKLADSPPTFDDNNQLREKIVVVVSDSEPDFRVLRTIARQQPAAIIRITDSPTSRPQIKRGSGRRRATYVSATINAESANTLVESVGGEAEWIEADGISESSIHPTDSELTITVRLREEPLAVPNVVAWLEGSDPELRHQYVTIGAHLDHLGTRGESTFNGADDNGSGSTAVLNIANALTSNSVKPKRSVLFIWFAAEEIGLVGSRHYCDNPTKPLEDMVCMFNMDMVGRNEQTETETAEENQNTIHLIGSQKGDSGLHELIMEANQYVNFEFEYDQESVFGRSDQANFYRKGIPVAFLFGGFHPNYHRDTDTIEKINIEKVTAASRLFYIAIQMAAGHEPFKLQDTESN